MGRRKTKAKKVAKKKKPGVPTVFKCLFCNHQDSVSVEMDTKVMIGDLKCSVCGANFQMEIHALSDPIDVYSE
jgi:transcription elongation factor Elf1